MRKFFYLMAMVCTLGFITACSSDDDPTPTIWDSYKGGDYQIFSELQSEEENDVEVQVVKMDMNVSKVDDTKAKITIVSPKLAHDITIPEALISQEGDSIVLTGTGTAVKKDISKATATTNPSDVVTINAKIKDSTVKLSMKWGSSTYYCENEPKGGVSDLIGTWETFVHWFNSDGEIDEPTGDADEWAEGSVKLNWEATEGTTINIPMDPSMPDFAIPMPVENARPLAERMANAQLSTVLQSVSFTSDGKIWAVYSDDDINDKPVWKVAKNYATYKEIADNQIMVYLNNDQILSTVEDATEKEVLKTILSLFKDGIPVNVEYSNEYKTAFFYVDKDFASELASNTVLAGLVKNLKDEDLDGMGFLIKSICNQIPGLMENTTKFQAGLELNKL